MDPRELTDAISKFCIERLGVLALELDANEAGVDGVTVDAKRITDLLGEAQKKWPCDRGLVG